MSAVWIPLVAAGLLVALDQLSKWLVTQSLTLGQSVPVIPGLLELRYVLNPGSAMGLLPDSPIVRIVLILITLVIIAVAVWLLITRRVHSRLTRFTLVLVLAGGVGNLIDRIFRGVVVDFLLFDFSWFPFVFNVADIFVTVGGGLMILLLVRSMIREKRAAAPEGDGHE